MTKLMLLVPLLLAACSDDRPPAPTAEEAEQLNEIEEALDSEEIRSGNAS